MTSFESPVKTIPAAIETVFDTLSDFSNLERLRDKIPEDKVQNFNCDPDNCRFTISAPCAMAPVATPAMASIFSNFSKISRHNSILMKLRMAGYESVLRLSV